MNAEVHPSSAPPSSLDPEAYYRVLADSIPHVVWMVRPDGYSEYLSKQGAAYMGMTNEETQGWGWLDAVHPDEVERVRALCRWRSASNQPYQSEFRMRR